MSVVDKNFVETKYSDLFRGMGKFEKPYTIQLKENSIPVSRPARRVPHAIMNKLKEKLNELEKQGIVKKTDDCSEWVQGIVVVTKKDKSLRICMDPADLNECILDDSFLIPTLDELTVKLKGIKHFSVLDLKDGFWHVQLDEQSQKLCTFSTPFGNYRFLVMPFGIKSGPKVFMRKNFEIFGDIKNVFIYMDDILILGRTKEEHDEALIKVLERAREKGVKLNINKLKIDVKQVKYLGHTFSENAIEPDYDRIEAIKRMSRPKDKKDMHKFLGVIGYVRPFTANMSELTAPLRELMKKNVIYDWTERQTEAFNKIKEAIANAPILVPFDENKTIQIQTDASKDGLGCCILQDGSPISFASRSLNEAEQRYSQIEKEFLSILFACNKFRYYTYGRKVKVVNDHKPLTAIMKKEINKIPSARLQNIRIKLLNYDIDLEYAPGKTIHIADYLSRYSMDCTEKDYDKSLDDAVLSINVSDERKIEFQRETNNDPMLKQLKEYCLYGWPNHKSKCDEKVKSFYTNQHEIFLDDDILFYNERIMVPFSMKPNMLSQLHEPHFGITKTKKRAREALYWPQMDNDIENMISKCEMCQQNARKNQKEPLIPHSIPKRPFERIACDIFEYKNRDYLAIADYYSNWIELKPLKGKTAKDVNLELVEVFSRNGIPQIVVSDNMPFDSHECKEFAKTLDFKFETSSPRYPQSNGLAEKTVQICKNILKKSQNMHDVYLALLEYRSTPTKDLSYSPSQLNQNRMLRTKIPLKSSKFEPKICTNVQDQLKNKQETYKKYYDRTAKSRNEFSLNDKVYAWINGSWQPGHIIGVWHTPRSYVVKTNDGEYRRNSRDIRKRLANDSEPKQQQTSMPTKCTRSGRQY